MSLDTPSAEARRDWILELKPDRLTPQHSAYQVTFVTAGGQPSQNPLLHRIEVFSDFECPACREFYLMTIRQVLRDYSSLNKVCVVYHEFPLPAHKYSREAARDSKAAQKLGRKQWLAVMDALYEHQPVWTQNGSVDDVVFKALGVDDYAALRRILLQPFVDAAIESELALGRTKGVTSTPTMFVYAGGKEQKVVGGVPYPVLKGFFDSIVK